MNANIFDATGALLPTLPANAVLVPILIGDSTAIGWESANTDVRGTLPGGATTLADAYLWNKWDSANQLVHADDGTDWVAIDNALGRDQFGLGAYIGPEFGLAYVLREAMRQRMPKGVDPDVRMVKIGASGAGFHESFVSAGGCWSPRRAGTTMYALLRDYYLTPAITDLLAEGVRVFLDALYVVGGGNDGLAPATYGYAPPNALAASYKTLRETLAADLGVAELPMVVAKTVSFYNLTYTNLDEVRYQQEVFAAANGIDLVPADDLERNTDGLHFTGQGSLEMGLRLGGMGARRALWQEITEAP